MFDELWELIEAMQSPVGLWEAVVAILFSLAASIVTYLMYQLF